MITSNTLARTFFIRTEPGDGGAGFTVINSVGFSNCRGFFGGPIISLRNGWRRPSVIGVISDFDEPKKPVVPEAKERQFRARENMNVIIGCGIEPVLEAIAGSTSGMRQELLVS
jgi:hypothetical protein